MFAGSHVRRHILVAAALLAVTIVCLLAPSPAYWWAVTNGHDGIGKSLEDLGTPIWWI